MRMAMIGLGKMGGNMVRRLCRRGIEVVGFSRTSSAVNTLVREYEMFPAISLELMRNAFGGHAMEKAA